MRVIVDLNGNSPRVARRAAARFLEHTNSVRSLEAATPRKYSIPPKAAKLERERMREKVRGTKKMRAAIMDVLDEWRSSIIEAAKFHEAATDSSSSLQQLDDELDAAVASGAITPEQRSAIAKRLAAAMQAMDSVKLAQVMHDIQIELYNAGLQSGTGEVGIAFDMVPQRAIDAMYHTTLEFSQDVVDREKVAIKDALLAGIEAGDGVDGIAKRIQDSFDDGMHVLDDKGNVVRVIPNDSWVEMVARTETSRAMNAGVFDAYKAAGVSKVMWIAADDERTCPECGDADGEVVAFGALFDSVDVDGPPAHPSCRCTTVSADDQS